MSNSPDPTDNDPELVTDVLLTRWNDNDAPHDILGKYVEFFWLPVLGPTATWLLRRFNHELLGADNVHVDLEYMAECMGMAYRAGRNSPFSKAIQRLVMFGFMAPSEHGFAVRTTALTVHLRQTRRWSDSMQQDHLYFLSQNGH